MHRRLYDGYNVPEDAAPFAWLRAAARAHGIEVAKVTSIGGSDTDVGDLARVTAWVRDALAGA